MQSIHDVNLIMGIDGIDSVELDGHAVAAKRIDLSAGDGLVTAVRIELDANVSVYGSSMADLIEANPGDTLDEFLSSVDPELLERRALSNMGMGDGGPGATAKAILSEFRRFVRGD